MDQDISETARTRSTGFVAAVALAIALALPPGTAGAQSDDPKKADDLKKSGSVTVSQTQVAFLYSGNLGGGKLNYEGKTHDFTIGGLGIGGIGLSRIEAKGEVYNLTDLKDFEGAYGQARTGFVAGTSGTGELWLQNPGGVYIHLETKREGLALSLGGDAIYISLD